MKTIYLQTLILFLIIACKPESKDNVMAPPVPKFKLSSASFDSGMSIPVKYTCDSTKQVFPELHWNSKDLNCASFVLLMDDPDAVPVVGYIWEHWLIYDLPGSTTSIGPGTDKSGPLPTGTKRGLTSFGDTLYGGPCPPTGQTHVYRFRLYGLDVPVLGLPSGSTSAQVFNAMKGHVVDSALLTGTFKH